MNNSNNLSKPPWQAKIAGWALLPAAIGFADALYLTISHYQNALPPCVVGSCEAVLTSVYATIGPIPIALIGALYYLAIIGCLMAYLDQKNYRWLKFWKILSLAGFVVTIGLVALQLFVIDAICQYCMISAGVSTTLFVMSLYIRKPVT